MQIYLLAERDEGCKSPLPPSSPPASNEIFRPYDAPNLYFSSTMAANANIKLFRAKSPF